MLFQSTNIEGLFLITAEKISDNRGFFARTFCAEEFSRQQLATRFVQSSISHNVSRYTLRGMHFQAVPQAETRLVSCIAGAIYDVAVDMRPHSPTLREYFAIELSPTSGSAVYIPPGCAHGFMTLACETTVHYQMSHPYHATLARGFHWADSGVGIPWPHEPLVISTRDAELPDFAAALKDATLGTVEPA